jgi:hypothetical protein
MPDKKIIRDYYQIQLDDFGLQDDPEERAQIAILEAQERARIYAVPCEWQVIDDDGYTVTVVRRRSA